MRLAFPAIVACLATGAQAFVYQKSVAMGGSAQAYVVTEGQMYLGGRGGPHSTVGMEGTLTLSGNVSASSIGLVVSVAFADEETLSSIGTPAPGLAENREALKLCCNPGLMSAGLCGLSSLGEVIVRPAAKGASESAKLGPVVSSFRPLQDPIVLAASRETRVEGKQWIVVVVCTSTGDEVPPAELTGEWSFRNPYGYLPGWRFGHMAYFGAIMTAYLVFTLVFAGAMLMRRQHAISLQGFVVALAVIGAIETGTLFAIFADHNESGVPFCCPTKPEVIVAAILTALKWAVSLAILLAVCLGYGVVLPNLPRPQWAGLAILTVAYFGACAFANTERLKALDGDDPSYLTIVPVAVLTVAFVAWIVGALQQVRKLLTESREQVKLLMYNRLGTALIVSIGLVLVVAILTVAVDLGVIPLPWQWYFLFTNDWDIVFLAILVTIGVLWFPGPTSAQYALYAQAATGEDDEGLVEDTGLGVDASARVATSEPVGAATAGGVARPSGHDGDSDGDLELAAMPVTAAASLPGRVANSRAADHAFSIGDEEDEEDEDLGEGRGSDSADITESAAGATSARGVAPLV
ncbi:hypothetical protein FNF29_06501 [Cafeteria roenbergensis]|uniref:GOST seven transmembrane domain-containing protein n=1 Tax=Cafeteria roenbergensis TaxID=33653 RepID=A0A5A8C835_CAFRO|nr:hypothetical protein FNF29_06501 [Cafeteria roenbergensis]|eukprot:KAA0148719.1 hypothetical protein FNF29_06501 [Cafeteria roenbergensis]